MNLLESLKVQAKELNKRIVLPESLEERTIQAADQLIEEKIAHIILIVSIDEV